MKEKDMRNPETESEEIVSFDEPQGWCSPEFPSGCILDTDLE
ncbi:hypothetical protein [Caproicibacter sp.]